MGTASFTTLVYFLGMTIAGLEEIGSPNGNYESVPVKTLEMKACGITFIAENKPDAFSIIRPKDVCRVKRSVERIIELDVGTPNVYLVPLHWSSTQGFPELAEGWASLEMENLSAMDYTAINLEVGVIQIDPLTISAQRSKNMFSSYSHSVRRWYAMTILSHELMHHTLRAHNVPLEIHHCIMLSEPKFWTESIWELGKEYGIKTSSIRTLVQIQENMYEHACTDIEYTFEE